MADAGFLAAIAADPRSGLARLVYADWLEERADPRGDYLRELCAAAGWAECPSREAAVARLQQMRGEFADDWLAAVQRGVPWKLLFEANYPTGAGLSGRFEFGPPATAEQIAETEAALGHRLTDELRELMAEFNGAEHLCQVPGYLAPTYESFLDLADMARDADPPGNSALGTNNPLVFVVDDGYWHRWGTFLADTGGFRAGEVVTFGHPGGPIPKFPSLFEFARRWCEPLLGVAPCTPAPSGSPSSGACYSPSSPSACRRCSWGSRSASAGR